jgi:hypothetical protein
VFEITWSTDPRASSPEVAAAKRKEIAVLIACNTRKIVCVQDVRDSAKILGGPFILTIKYVNTGNEFLSSLRYSGHKDIVKSQLVHNSTTLMISSSKLIHSFAALFRFVFGIRMFLKRIPNPHWRLCAKSFYRPQRKTSIYFKMTSDEVLQLPRPL